MTAAPYRPGQGSHRHRVPALCCAVDRLLPACLLPVPTPSATSASVLGDGTARELVAPKEPFRFPEGTCFEVAPTHLSLVTLLLKMAPIAWGVEEWAKIGQHRPKMTQTGAEPPSGP